jgi:hypothetical protein
MLLIFGIALLAQISGPPTPTWSTFRIASFGRLVKIRIREAASIPSIFVEAAGLSVTGTPLTQI